MTVDSDGFKDTNCGWNFTTQVTSIGCTLDGLNDSKIVVTAESSSTYTTEPTYSAKFDALIYSNINIKNNLVPSLPNDGEVDSSYNDNSGTTATVTWSITGNPNDTYRIYTTDNSIDSDSGYIDYTACGAQEFLTEVTSSLTITTNGDQSSVTFDGLDRNTQKTVVIIADRTQKGGYKTAYKVLTIGGSSTLSASLLLCIVCIYIISIVREFY